MSRITIVPIVEGHGEVAAVPNLLWRTWTEIVGGEHVEHVKPILVKRNRFLKQDDAELSKAVELAARRIHQEGGGMILILLDRDEHDCDKNGPLGPALLGRAQSVRADKDIACVIANVMYETWFVAAAESWSEYLNIKEGVPVDPEGSGLGKGWIKKHMKSRVYSETADQPALTTKMDLRRCRERSKSFDKLCRDLESRFQKMQISTD